MKMPNFKNLLNDKNVLYVVFILAILNILGYLLVQNLEAVAFFLVVGFLTTYFSKNMIIVLMVSIVSTSIFTSTRTRMVKEGMSSKKNTGKDKDKDMDMDNEDDNDNKSANESSDKPASNLKMNSGPSKEDDSDDDDETETEGMAVSSGKKKNFVSHADNLENAYKKLHETVGKGGIEGLTGQTKKLLDQQESLMNNIKGMEPFLATAESFMSKIDLSSLDNISGMLSKFGGK